MKIMLLLVALFTISPLLAQDIVPIDDVYAKEGLTYAASNDQPFTGRAQKIRKNGHLMYEEYIESGYLIKRIIYFNGTESPTPARVTEYYKQSTKKRTESNYGLKDSFVEIIQFDQNGAKTLVENYKNDTLTYRCPYVNNKKHGSEFCFDKNGVALNIEYRDGKKVAQKER